MACFFLLILQHLNFLIPERMSGEAMYYKHGPKACQIIANIGKIYKELSIKY